MWKCLMEIIWIVHELFQPHELLSTKRQKAKVRNLFENKVATDV